MLKLKSLLSLAFLILAGGCLEMELTAEDELLAEDDLEIVGGTDANIADYPWQISFQTSSGSHFCGGSVLSADWVLTAQHCVVGSSPSSVRIEAGISNLSASGQIRNVAQIIPYPGYVDASKGKDVALLRLSTPLDLSGPNVKAIPLVTATDASNGLTNPGVVSTVTGWGTLSSGGPSPDRLQTVDVPLVSNADAQAAYPQETITADQIGAGLLGVGGKDSCQGDSGGPLTVPSASGDKLAGVVSWGYGCADPDYPGMYARVSSFESWITSTMGGQQPPPTGTELQDGQTVSSLSGSTGVWLHYFIKVPTGASKFTATISGGTGDADLYVKLGSQPTTSSYDCRPYVSGNAETCTFNAPQAGTYYVSIRAYSSFSGVSLNVNYDLSTGGYPGLELNQTNLSASSGTWKHYTLAVPADATTLTVKTANGTGDADLYVRKGAQPTTTAYDCRPYLSGNNETCNFTTGVGGATWYISVRAYSAYSGVTLTGDYEK